MDNDTRAKLLRLDDLDATPGDPGSGAFDRATWEATKGQMNKLIEEIEAAHPGFEVLHVDIAPTEHVAQLRYALVPEQEIKGRDARTDRQHADKVRRYRELYGIEEHEIDQVASLNHSKGIFTIRMKDGRKWQKEAK